MRLLVDENIPLADQALSSCGEVRLVAGRSIRNDMLHDVDVLIVRSVTAVNAALLHKTPVRFVGTATIGVDHVDVDYLRSHGITFAYAPGSNANSVAEYVTAAIVNHACVRQLHLPDLTIGVVGVGNAGSRVVQFAQALGLRVLQNDPPRQRSENKKEFIALDELMHADIISLHTPLTKSGDDVTYHLFDAKRLAHMKDDSLLINTARGGVVKTAALKNELSRDRLTAYLDVWENEPEIDSELLQHVGIGTPHIAGYSYDGKINGTYQIYKALCHFLNRQPEWQPEGLPLLSPHTIKIEKQATLEAYLRQAISAAYDIIADSGRLKMAITHSQRERGRYFDTLRANYPIRREFPSYKIASDNLDGKLVRKLQAIGFEVQNG